MKKQLENIILSTNAVDEFYQNYNGEFKNWLDNLLPEVDKCINQKQINPWHKYNVMTHILHSVEEINKLTININDEDKRILAYTMFLHDIGKPACHIRRIVKGTTRDSFFNHNIESEKVARRFLKDLQIDSNTIEIIAKLVFKHDIFMFIKDFPTNNPYWKQLTPEVIRQEVNDLSTLGDGKKFMSYLIMIGKSDNLAQNEEMTAPSLKMLDKCTNILNNL